MPTPGKKHAAIAVLFVTVLFWTIVISALIAFFLKERQVTAQAQERQAQYSQILDGISTGPIEYTVNYSHPSIPGSPLIFGGSHHPTLEHTDAWNKIQDVGVTMIRTDLAINWMIRNTTLENYKKNANNIQDIKNWNTYDLNKTKNVFLEAKKRGMKTIGIMDYSPPWLSHDGTDFGVPKDWEVYEDLVKKTYTYHRDHLDYVEIWNEANHSQFLTVGNSGMSKKEAYGKIFYHASKAIREVDMKANDGKMIPIGGPVDPAPGSTMLEAILENPESQGRIDFISYHNYHNNEPSNGKYKDTLNKFNMSSYPIFLTEWNYDGRNNIDHANKTSDKAITYTGDKLISLLNMGIAGSNYYSLQPVKDNSIYLSFYRWENGQATLLPQAKTWRLLSKQMALGKGKSSIFPVSPEANEAAPGTNTLNSTGFKNINGQYGVTMVNPSKTEQMVQINVDGTDIKYFAKARLYYASKTDDATSPTYEGTVKVENGRISFVFPIPAGSIAGVTFTPEHEWYDNIPLPIDKIVR